MAKVLDRVKQVNTELGREMTYSKIFLSEDGGFSAWENAIAWLRVRGYAFGPICGNLPVGIIKLPRGMKVAALPKWKDLDLKPEIRKMLVGAVVSENFRDASVLVILDHDPDGRFSAFGGG